MTRDRFTFFAASAVILGVLFLADLPAKEVSSQAASSVWQSALSAKHRASLQATNEGRLDDLKFWREMAKQEFAGNEKPAKDTRLFAELVDKKSVPIAESALSGKWRCRTLRVENNGLTVFPYFNCEIGKGSGGLTLNKLDGSKLFSGTLYARDKNSMVLLSSWRAKDEPEKVYGLDETRSDVGFLFQIGKERLRLEFPNNSSSLYDVVELVKSK
jgi:Domain of unknown function (DUF4893)